MSGNSTGKVLGAATVVGGGAAILPNTAGSMFHEAVLVATITLGCLAVISMIAMRLYARISR